MLHWLKSLNVSIVELTEYGEAHWVLIVMVVGIDMISRLICKLSNVSKSSFVQFSQGKLRELK